ncbi:hypothetical protein V1520DRAFT_214663 [Lipomyces starkeyi]
MRISFTLFSILLFITGYVSHKFRIFQIINEFFLFLWQEGVLVRFVKAFSGLTLVLLAIFIPVWKIAIREAERNLSQNRSIVSARDQLRRRGSF